MGPELGGRIEAQRGRGDALDERTRAEMEGSFGTPLDQVRVHTDGEADALNRSVSARSATSSSEVAIAPPSPKQGRFFEG